MVADDIEFVVPDSYLMQYVTMTDELKHVNFSFTKTDFSGTRLAGAEYELYYCYNVSRGHTHDKLTSNDLGCWTKLTTESSDMNGVLEFNDLVATRTYALVEKTSPEGHQIASGYWLITYDESTGVGGTTHWSTKAVGTGNNFQYSEDNGWTLADAAKFHLPQAGGSGRAWLLFAGLSLMVLTMAGTSLLVVVKRRKCN